MDLVRSIVCARRVHIFSITMDEEYKGAINVVAKNICKKTLRVMDGTGSDPTFPLVKLEKCVE